MNKEDEKTPQKQVVLAPQSHASIASGSVLSVEIDSDEDVEWQWMHFPNGQSAVMGYKIAKKNICK